MNEEIIGYYEDEFLPYIYAPYVPLIQTPAIDQLFPLNAEKKEEIEVDWMKEGF